VLLLFVAMGNPSMFAPLMREVVKRPGFAEQRELLGLLQQQFPEGTLTVQDVLRFVAMLHEAHLLVGEGAGHATWLAKRRAAA
jgi:hypothetical protein